MRCASGFAGFRLRRIIETLAEMAPGEAEPALNIGEAHVRRAEAWIEANLAEPVGVHEMASAISVGFGPCN